MKKWLNNIGVSMLDLVIFVPFALVYAIFGAIWTTSSGQYMAGDLATGLQIKKDIMYYLLWACAIGYAVLANTAVLWGKAARGGLIAFVVTLVVMVAVFFGLTFGTQALSKTIPASTKVLSIAIGDILVLLPIVTATVFFFIAWIVTGFSNHLRGQPVAQGFVRLGVALMVIPVVQFLVIVFLPRWDDEVRGVVFVHAMSLGLLWGLFLGGGLGSNLRKRSGTPATA